MAENTDLKENELEVLNASLERLDNSRAERMQNKEQELKDNYERVMQHEVQDRAIYEQKFTNKLLESQDLAHELYSNLFDFSGLEQLLRILQYRHKFGLRYSEEHIPTGFTDMSKTKFRPAIVKFYHCLSDEAVVERLTSKGFPANYLIYSSWNYMPKELEEKEQNYFAAFLQKVKNHILDDFFIDDSNSTGLCIQGKIGVGKSSLLALIAKLLYKYLDVDVRYTTALDYLNAFSSLNSGYLETIKASKILFIDGLGQENYNENRMSAMFDLFHYRYSNSAKLVTFIAGNFDINDWKASNNQVYAQIASYCSDKKFVTILDFKGSSKRS